MSALYLLRHGDADYGPVHVRSWTGAASDLAPLTARSRSQAMAAARQLPAVGVAEIVSSPMTHALQIAALVASLGLLVEVDFELREWLPDDTFSWRSYSPLSVVAVLLTKSHSSRALALLQVHEVGLDLRGLRCAAVVSADKQVRHRRRLAGWPSRRVAVQRSRPLRSLGTAGSSLRARDVGLGYGVAASRSGGLKVRMVKHGFPLC
jgi:hypothetical protein